MIQPLLNLADKPKKKSLKETLKELFVNHNGIYYTEFDLYDILRNSRISGMPSTISRRCRELAEIGKNGEPPFLKKRIREGTNYMEFSVL